MQCTLFSLNLLETETVSLGIEASQTWSCPFLILFRVVLLQTLQVLGHLLQDLGFEVTGLARAQLPLRSILRALEPGGG